MTKHQRHASARPADHGDGTRARASREADLSPAERVHRDREADNARRIAASAVHTRAAIGDLRGRIPEGWHITAGQFVDGARHTIDITPPAGRVKVMAYLSPPDDDTRWRVRVHNRTDKVDFPLYSHGGARAAQYRTARDALAAAIHALTIELHAAGKP